MRNHITVTIAGQEYTIVAAEEENYVRRVAGHVDNKVQEVLSGGRASLVESVVLAALNIARRRRRICAASSRSTWRRAPS